MFCHKCGKEIDNDAVVCVHCGSETKNLNNTKDKSINIVNQTSSSSTSVVKVKKNHNLLLDVILIFCTGGLWIFWMIIRSFL